ncbi:MAG: hypothetical protein ACI8Z1_000737 [Candidatus Azotimanducaceae bacterium]|jgi:hypothetical protein
MQMDEIGLFTVANGKIVQEEYLYLVPAVSPMKKMAGRESPAKGVSQQC